MLKKHEIISVHIHSQMRMRTPNIGLFIHESEKDMFAPFYILDHTVHVLRKECKDIYQTGSVMDHEMGHMVYCPGTLAKSQELLDNVMQQHDIADQGAHHLINVAGDMIVDFSIKEYHNSPLSHRLKVSLDSINKNKSLGSNYFIQVLEHFYDLVCGENIFCVKDKEARGVGKQSYTIVRMNIPMENKVYKIIDLFKKEVEKRKQGEKELMEALQKASVVTGTNSDFSSTQDSSSAKDKQDLKNKMADAKVDRLNDKQTRGCTKGDGDGSMMGVGLSDRDLIKAKARKNIRIKGLSITNKSGKIASCGYEQWQIDNNPEDLEFLESLQDGGIIIPGVTTLKKSPKMGYDEVSIGCPPIILCVDTSGSMSHYNALISLCSFVEAARHYMVKVGVVLFHQTVYYKKDATFDYDDLIDDCFNKLQSGGTSIRLAIEAVKDMKIADKLVVMVTDWEDYNEDELAAEFGRLQSSCTVTVNFGYKSVKGCKEIKIPGTEELEDSLIDLVNNAVQAGVNQE